VAAHSRNSYPPKQQPKKATLLQTQQDLEHGGEVAHSDVIKAELQMQERRRQF